MIMFELKILNNKKQCKHVEIFQANKKFFLLNGGVHLNLANTVTVSYLFYFSEISSRNLDFLIDLPM